MFYSQLAAENSNIGSIWILLVLFGILIIMAVFSFSRRKKFTQQTQDMINALKPGDKVKTYSGFYGTIVSIKETTDGKVLLLEMGEDSKIGYLTVDSNAIFGLDGKEDIVYDADGNIVMPVTNEEIEQVSEAEIDSKEKKEEVVENDAYAVAEDIDDVLKPTKTAKKKGTTTKKSKK